MVKMRCIVVFLMLLAVLCAGKLYAQSLDINDQSAEVGDTVTFTVSMSNIPNEVGALQFEVSYDTSVLDFTDNYTNGSLADDFTYFEANEASSGRIRVVGITTSEIESGSSGEVVKLEFTVKNCANSTLTLTGLEDDLAGWSTGDGEFSCTAISETPTPAASPTVCEATYMWADPSNLTLTKKESDQITVVVRGGGSCQAEGETVTATINKAGKKRISISSTSLSTDANGECVFTITAKKKTGNAKVTFKQGKLKTKVKVKVVK